MDPATNCPVAELDHDISQGEGQEKDRRHHTDPPAPYNPVR